MSDDTSSFDFAAFISHSAADFEFADDLRSRLEARGLRCWIAPRDVRPGTEYPEEISRGINRSRCLILVLSSAANESPSVRREAEMAVRAGKPIFPVRIEDVPPSPKLEFLISITQWIDVWEGQLATHVSTLIEAMQQNADFLAPRVEQKKKHGAGSRLKTAGVAVAAVLATVIVLAAAIRWTLREGVRAVEQASSALEQGEAQLDENMRQLGERASTAFEESTRDLRANLRGVLNGSGDTRSPAEQARAYLSHPGRDAFVERARADLAAFDSLPGADGRCRFPANMSGVRPAVVASVWPNHTSELRPGDVVVRIANEPVGRGGSEVAARVAPYSAGETLPVRIDRNGNEIDALVTCVRNPSFDRLTRQFRADAVELRWEACARGAVTLLASFGSQSTAELYTAHCARYAGLLDQAKWSDQLYRYYVALIREAALGGLSDLEAVGAMLTAETYADLGQRAGDIRAVYENAAATVRRN
jgi:hypothetical protein